MIKIKKNNIININTINIYFFKMDSHTFFLPPKGN